MARNDGRFVFPEKFLEHSEIFKAIWRIDNYAAAKIIKVGSPVADLHEISLDIFDLCFQNQITLKPVWVPRIQNKEADRVSRIIDIDDWEITSIFFNYLDSLWGPFYNRQIRQLSKQETSEI